MRLGYAFLLPACGLLAQPVSIGFKVGSPLNDPASQISTQSAYTQSRWTGGPTLEVSLPFRFAIEVDALYWASRTNANFTFRLGQNLNAYAVSSVQRTRSWDFPILLKHRFEVRSLRPFISAGYLFTRESIDASHLYQCSGPQGSCIPADYPVRDIRAGESENSRFRGGPAAGVGLEFRTGRVTITPELRFSRLINTAPRDNRFTAMVGFTFGGSR